MENTSCYGCKNRYVGCHSTCAIYAKYKATLEKIKLNKQIEYKFYHLQKRKR